MSEEPWARYASRSLLVQALRRDDFRRFRNGRIRHQLAPVQESSSTCDALRCVLLELAPRIGSKLAQDVGAEQEPE